MILKMVLNMDAYAGFLMIWRIMLDFEGFEGGAGFILEMMLNFDDFAGFGCFGNYGGF